MWLDYSSTWSLLVALTLVTIAESGYNDNTVGESGQQASNFKCKEEGYHADPQNCKIYYRCVDYGSGGPLVKFNFECGPGTVFSKSQGDICTYASVCGRKECGDTNDESDKTNDIDSNNTHETGDKKPHVTGSTGTTAAVIPSSVRPSQGAGSTAGWISSTESNTQATNKPNIGTECKRDGFMADPHNCATFYRCVDEGNGSYRRYEFTCGAGTVWDPKIETCNHAWAANRFGCNVPTDSYPSREPSHLPSSTGTTAAAATQSSVRPSQGDSSTAGSIITTESIAQAPEKPNIGTVCTYDGFMADPQNCRKFYRCVDEGNASWRKYEFTCGVGTVWDVKIETCNHPWAANRVGCKIPTDSNPPGEPSHVPDSTGTTPAIATSSVSTSQESSGTAGLISSTESIAQAPSKPNIGTECTREGFMADPQNCCKFYRCVDEGNGSYRKYEFTCGVGTVWDPKIETCNHPWAANRVGCQIPDGSSEFPPSGGSSGVTPSGDSSGVTPSGGSSEVTPSGDSSVNTPSGGSSDNPPEGDSSNPGQGSPGVTPTTVPSTSGGCDSKCTKEGFFANENDCRKFYRCVRAGTSGYAKFEFTCGTGTAWDQELRTCNYINQVASCKANGNSTPSGCSSAAPPSGDSTEVTPSDGSTEFSPSGGSTEISPSDGPSGVPPSDVSTEVPPSDGSTEVSPSDGSSGIPPSGGSTGIPHSDGSTEISPSDGSSGVSPSDGPSGVPPSDVSTEVPPSDGSTEVSPSDGSSGIPPSGGSTEMPHSDGSTEAPPSSGSTEFPPSGGSTEISPSDGSTEVTPSGSSTEVSPPDESSEVPSSGGSIEVPPSDGSSEVPTPDDSTQIPPSGDSSKAPPPGKCESKCTSEGFFANENDCTKFYRCVGAGPDSYTKFEFSCGPGTAWDQGLLTCNYIGQVNSCKRNSTDKPSGDACPGKPAEITAHPESSSENSSSSSSPSSSESSSSSSTSSENSSSSPSSSESSSSSPSSSESTSEGSSENDSSVKPWDNSTKPNNNNGIVCKKEGFYSNPNHCDKFYRCVDNGNGFNVYHFDCPPGTIFDPSINVCNYPSSIYPARDCKGGQNDGGTTGPTGTNEKPPCSGESTTPSVTESTGCGVTESTNKPEGETTEASINSTPEESSSASSEATTSNSAETSTETVQSTASQEEQSTTVESGSSTEAGSESSGTTTSESAGTSIEAVESTTSQEEQSTTAESGSSTEAGTESSGATTSESAETSTETAQSTTSKEELSTTVESGSSNEAGTESSGTTTSESAGTSTEAVESTTSQEEQSTTAESGSSTEAGTESSGTTTSESEGISTETAESTTSREEQSTTLESGSSPDSGTESSGATPNSESQETTTETEQQGTESANPTTSSESEVSVPATCPIGNLTGEQILLVCPTGFRRHPKYCNIFYQCTSDTKMDVKILSFHCPENTIFDEKKIRCLPENETTEPCSQLKAGARVYRRVESTPTTLFNMKQHETLCPGEGYHPYNHEECSNVFYRCKKDSNESLQGYLYKCPENFVFWSISRRCERVSRLPTCSDQSKMNEYDQFAWQLPVENSNRSLRVLRDR